MRKIEVPIVILVIAGIIGFVCFFSKEKDKKEEPKFIGAVSMISTDYKVISQQGDYFAFYGENDLIGLINDKDEIVLEPKYEDIEYADKDYFIVKKADEEGYYKKYVIDLNEKTYLEGYSIIVFKNKDKVYYYVMEDKGIDIYDDEFGKYYECEDCTGHVEGFIYSDNTLYDLFGKKTYNYDKKALYFGGTLFFNGKTAYSVGIDGEFKTYKNASIDDYVVTLGNDKYFLYENVKVNKDNTITLNKNYSAKLSESCPYGSVNIYEKDKLYSEECFDVKIEDGLFVLSTRNVDGSPITKVFLNNGNVLEKDNILSVEGNIIISSFQENSYYDLEGNELDLQCTYIEAISDNSYACTVYGEGVTLLDKEFNPIEDGKYDSISCDGYLCVVELDHNYGALYNGKKILDLTFPNLRKSNNILFAEGISENLVVTLGTENINYDIVYSESKYKEIDVDKVIEDYDLQDIKEEIKDNEELFKKYAYIVLNNDGLVTEYKGKEYNYRRYVLMTFKVFAHNKKYLYEYNMLDCLKNLHFIVNAETSVSGAAGTYSYGEIVLMLDYAQNGKVIYHELMHMVDYTINERYINSKKIYVCGDDVVITKANKNECEGKYLDQYTGLITEGGAEYYSGLYLQNMRVSSYGHAVNALASLAYIYGDDTINDIYFSPYSEIDLFELLHNDGMSLEDYQDFLQVSSSITVLGGKFEEKNFQKCLKYLIDIYKRKKGDKWYEDKEFLITLDNYVYAQLDRNIVGDEIANNLKLFNGNSADNLAGENLMMRLGYSYEVSPGCVIRSFDGKTYLSIQAYAPKEADDVGFVVIEFNPSNEEVINYKFYSFKEA